DHLLARLRAAQQCGKLRALVLDFDLAFQECRLGVDRGAFGVRANLDALPPGRPARRLRAEIGQLLRRLPWRRLERVDPQTERPPGGGRLGLPGALVAEGGGELLIEPFGIVAAYMRWRTIEAVRAQPCMLFVGERLRREARAARELRDRVDIEPTLA